MAAKVNVKFVVILSAVVLVVFTGAAATAFFVATKSAAEYVALGDAQAEEGNWEEAASMYERAVGHADARTNIEYLTKWRDALEKVPFNRAVVFENRYFTKYRPLVRQIALTDRANINQAHQYLGMMLEEIVFSPFSAERHEQLITEAEDFLRYFEGNPPGEWSTLRRYRGIARARMMQFKADVSEDEADLTLEDLDAAIEADPSDEQSIMAIAQFLAARAERAFLDGERDEAERIQQDLAARLNAFVEANPTAIQALAGKLRVDMFYAINEMRDQPGMTPEKMAVAVNERFTPVLDSIEASFREQGAENLDTASLLQFREIEVSIDADGGGRRTKSLAQWAADAQPRNGRLLIVLADAQERSREYEAALETLTRVLNLPDPTMGLDGLFLFNFRQQAVAQQTRLATTRWTLADAEDKPALLEEARGYRDDLASRVAEDSPVLKLADARLLIAEDKPAEAERLLVEYNVATGEQDPEAMGILGRLAARQDKLGIARDMFTRVLEVNPIDINAMLGLANVLERLGEFEEAEFHFQQVLKLLPDNESALQGVRRVRLRTGDETPDDPVEAALVEAQRIGFGNALEPGDPRAAIDVLRRAASENNYDERLVSSLVRRLLDMGEREDAVAEVRLGLEGNPDSEILNRLLRIASAEDPTDALIQVIDESDRTPLEKALTKYDIYSSNNRVEPAMAALEAAEAADPNDARVIELAFVRAVATGDEARASELAQRATETNADTVDGLTYRARLEMIDRDTEAAIDTLEEALDTDPNNAAAWRLLGRTQLLSGNTNGALESFERAASIRPNDIGITIEQVQTLLGLGRSEDALSLARQKESFGRGSAPFVRLWLGLEATVGDRELARDRREDLRDLFPEDRANRAALVRIYMDLAEWDKAKAMIDELRAESDSIGLVGLEAEWHASQNDLEAAQSAYAEYIIDQDPDTLTSRPFLEMGRFLLDRNLHNRGLAAIEQAKEFQSPEIMEGDRAHGGALMQINRFEEAIVPLRTVVDAGADDEQNTYRKRLAESLVRANRLEEADAELGQLTEANSGDVTTLLLRAEVGRLSGRLREAEELLNQAITQSPENPVIFVQRARVVADQPGRRADAYADLDEALRLRPGYSDALQYYAQVLYNDGREDEAIERLKDAVTANPTLDDLTFRLVNELLRLNRGGEAMQTAMRSIELRPRDLQRKILFARIFQQATDWDRAAELFKLAWEQSRQEQIGRMYVDALLTARPPKVRQARAVLTELAQITDLTKSPRLLAQRAMCFHRLGNSGQAATDTKAAFDLVWDQVDAAPQLMIQWLGWASQVYAEPDPDDLVRFLSDLEEDRRDTDPRQAAWTRMLRGRALVAFEDRRDEGIAILRGMLREDNEVPIQILTNRTLAGAYFDAKDYTAAVEHWRVVMDLDDRDWEAANNLAYTLARHLDQPDEASPFAEIAVQLQQGNPQVRDTLAVVRIKQGRFQEADDLLHRTLVGQPSPAVRLVSLVHRGQARLGLGDIETAQRLLQEAEKTAQIIETVPAPLQAELDELKREIDSR